MRLFAPSSLATAALTTTLTLLSSPWNIIQPVDASSNARNALHTLGVVKNTNILTPNHRVNALSTFDLAFDIHGTRVRLALEPNHDILGDDTVISYLGPDGYVARTETINRLDHKVYKGRAWLQDRDKSWHNAGFARIAIRRDGVDPLFEGVFSLNRDHHHIQLAHNYMATRHELDPLVEPGQDYMVCFRDSDVATEMVDEHGELRRRGKDELACQSDQLGFNMGLDNPVYAGMVPRDDGESSDRDRFVLKRSDSFWTSPIANLLGKRQNDIQPGGGNSAGVNLVSTIGNTNGCPTTRRIALVGVVTDCEYTKSFDSQQNATANIIQQINSASDLYERTFNITLGLANLTVSPPECPSSPPAGSPWNQACAQSSNIQDRLNVFSGWRGQQKDSNSHWTLMTKCQDSSAVGLAWLGQACVQGSQNANATGGGKETVAGANVVVRTSTEWQVIAHETGHTFGAVHDCTSTTCADGQTVSAQQCCPRSAQTCDAGQKFIMNPSTSPGVTDFSPCTIGNICSALLRNSVKSTCLTNNRDIKVYTGQQCGNGIVEAGEDCDCGGEAGCGNNQCCDAKTCKFKNNAVCDDANEDCCNQCRFAPATQVCRASTGQCDPEERCSGQNATCPRDTTAPDGQDCGGGLKCASGQCTSRDRQCKTVMGSYTQGNDTYACDHSSCSLSCASPEFGPNVCYGLQQNFLDGTECGGGGHCSNGRCLGSSPIKEAGDWLSRNRNLAIGIGAGLGGLLALCILTCIIRCVRRARSRKARTRALNRQMSEQQQQHWPGGAAAAAAAGLVGAARNRSRGHGGSGSSSGGGERRRNGRHGPSDSRGRLVDEAGRGTPDDGSAMGGAVPPPWNPNGGGPPPQGGWNGPPPPPVPPRMAYRNSSVRYA